MAHPDLFDGQRPRRPELDPPERKRAPRRREDDDARKVYFRAPRNAVPKRCSLCPAEIVWAKTDRGKRMPLHWASRRFIDGHMQAEPHWGFCPRADDAKRGGKQRECQAYNCTERGPRLFCDFHRRLVPDSIAQWIERIQLDAKLGQTPALSREWGEALEAARKAVRKLERERRA